MAERAPFDVIIIGAGYAGLTAALQLKAARKKSWPPSGNALVAKPPMYGMVILKTPSTPGKG